MKPFTNLACRSRLTLVVLATPILLCGTFASLTIAAQSLPDKCVKLPQRTTACENIIYKRSPIDVPLTNTKQGEVICICIADFASLRIAAETEVGKVDQLVELSRKSVATGLAEKDLLKLIRN